MNLVLGLFKVYNVNQLFRDSKRKVKILRGKGTEENTVNKQFYWSNKQDNVEDTRSKPTNEGTLQ